MVKLTNLRRPMYFPTWGQSQPRCSPVLHDFGLRWMLHGAMEGARETMIGCPDTNTHITLGPGVSGGHLHVEVTMKAQRRYRKASSKWEAQRFCNFGGPKLFAFSIPIVLSIEFDPEGHNVGPFPRRPIRNFVEVQNVLRIFTLLFIVQSSPSSISRTFYLLKMNVLTH